MKYLKLFNESNKNNIDDIIQNCKDILAELKDDGFGVRVGNDGFDNLKIKIFKYDGNKYMKIKSIYPKVKDYILTLADYAKNEGYDQCKLFVFDEDNEIQGYYPMNQYEKYIDNGKLDRFTTINIYLKTT